MTRLLGETRAERVYRLLMFMSAAIVSVLALYAVFATFYFGYEAVGETLVNLPSRAPFEFPGPEYFPVYAKPVTWLYVAIITFWFTFLESFRQRFSRLPVGAISVAKLVAFVLAAVSAYEVYYNFTIWGSLMTYQAITGNVNPDILANKFPNPQTPWNLVFATKFFSSILVVSLYSLYFMMRMERERKSLPPV
ncbi:MAG: hypothetical protein HYU39_02360 [Thaumarchaeota archaeon]|nr:hypothetical protein [Nitrososphaerota archaeon]